VASIHACGGYLLRPAFVPQDLDLGPGQALDERGKSRKWSVVRYSVGPVVVGEEARRRKAKNYMEGGFKNVCQFWSVQGIK